MVAAAGCWVIAGALSASSETTESDKTPRNII
jgi:hypothetical protein